MPKQSVGSFKYHLGISSLEEVASRSDRVCVLNVLGGESSQVTPVSHAFSGGNVVFGTSPGRRGQALKTPLGDVPVFNSVREGLDAGHRFNTGVVYLPPSGVRDGVAELARVNPELEKIVVVTEKVSVHDSREMRAIGQMHHVDIFGANGLGVADSWSRVRIGGALGGDDPGETLRKGSVAIFSNSGNFTTTIANYLLTAGWGTTTLISSGKDVYIHFAAPEFAFALANDRRSQAAVLYVEPGGYYEQDIDLTKPAVVCVVGRWKARISRAVGHAGAMAGAGDDAAAKERWFMERFGVDGIFTPENPACSAKGAVVINIADIPTALTAVMRLNGVEPDFPPVGNLALKPWFGNNQGLRLPPALDLPVVEAMAPYAAQIADLDRQIGLVLPRQVMRDRSGASVMDARSQITSLHGVSILELAKRPLESNMCFALTREPNGQNDDALANAAIASMVNLHGTAELAAAEAARQAGNLPNSVAAAACSIVGPKRAEPARLAARAMIDLFAPLGLADARDEAFVSGKIEVAPAVRAGLVGEKPDPRAEAMLSAVAARGGKSAFIAWLRSLRGHPTEPAVLAAIATTIGWGPLMRKRIARITVESLPWHMMLYAVQLGASAAAARHEEQAFCGVPNDEILRSWTATQLAYLCLIEERPTPEKLFPFQVLASLLLTNGPGSISAQGAKGAVSADGPEVPERVQINKAVVGFLTHTGYAHGGAGYEGIAFLADQFRGSGLGDPGSADHGIDLRAMATAYAKAFGLEKTARKEAGAGIRAIAGVNHPIFKGQPVNTDPREAFLRELFRERGEHNVFHDYYHALVRALFDEGVTTNVFCVNIDGVISALLLKMLWARWQAGTFSDRALEDAAFTIFLYGRMVGCAAEIDDHLNRGRNMDTRTPASQCGFVS
jgi:succinyl-CoA synthetase alpha subunit